MNVAPALAGQHFLELVEASVLVGADRPVVLEQGLAVLNLGRCHDLFGQGEPKLL